MLLPDQAPPNTFCWLDLATGDLASAMAFYGHAFGWSFASQRANGGQFTRCIAGSLDVGSMYPLDPAQRERGTPSHWTPYLRVDAIDALVARTASLGGRVLVAPFEVELVARIALIEDPTGAVLGLWQPLVASRVGTIGP